MKTVPCAWIPGSCRHRLARGPWSSSVWPRCFGFGLSARWNPGFWHEDLPPQTPLPLPTRARWIAQARVWMRALTCCLAPCQEWGSTDWIRRASFGWCWSVRCTGRGDLSKNMTMSWWKPSGKLVLFHCVNLVTDFAGGFSDGEADLSRFLLKY